MPLVKPTRWTSAARSRAVMPNTLGMYAAKGNLNLRMRRRVRASACAFPCLPAKPKAASTHTDTLTSRALTIPYPHIPPDLIRIGPFALRWYGVMYVVGYVVGIGIARRRVRRGLVPFDEPAVDALVWYLVIGMLLGARLLYVLIYDPSHYAANPLDAVDVWH